MSEYPAASAARDRYGAVLLLTLVSVVFVIVVPDSAVSRAVALLLEGGILLVVIATSREGRLVRGVTAGLVGLALLGLALAVATSAIPSWVGSAATALALLAVLVAMVRAVARLIRDQGVTPRAVAGALAIYLLVGLTFALVIALIARAGTGSYFTQGGDGTTSQQVYFSFVTLTTTGYGDLTPATSVGRAVSVLETLTGQIYLVTVIGLLVGNLNRSSQRRSGA